jgi:hypothetical protein
MLEGSRGAPTTGRHDQGWGCATLWCSCLLALLRLSFGLRLRVRYRNFGFRFVQFREYFLCNFSEIQKQQKTGTGTVASC